MAHQPPIKAWPGLTTKAATTPLAMSDLGIAGIADISPIIAPASAFSALVARGITVSLAGITSKFVPARIVDVNDAGSFCAEGAPIPVHQSTILTGPEIKPYKLACIIVLTRDTVRYQEVGAGGNPASAPSVPTLYVRKSAMPDGKIPQHVSAELVFT